MHRNCQTDTALLCELAVVPALSANAEGLGYPGMAKIYLRQQGIIASEHSRVQPSDVREKIWALDPIIDHTHRGTVPFRERIAAGGSQQLFRRSRCLRKSRA